MRDSITKITNSGEGSAVNSKHAAPGARWRSRQFIFVVGLHRSGTSMLSDMLANHSQISGFVQNRGPMNEGQHLQNVMVDRHGRPLDGVGSLALRSRNRLTERSRIADPDHAERLWRQWSKHWDMRAPRVVEKSPGNLIKTRLLQYYFPNSYFIAITRHPLVQAMAIKKWVPNRTAFQFVTNWRLSYGMFRKDSRSLARHYIISYEELCVSPHRTMEKLLNFIGAPIEDVVDRELLSSNERYLDMWIQSVGKFERFASKAIVRGEARLQGYSI